MKRGVKPFSVELLVQRGIFSEDWKEKILQLGREGKNKMHFATALGISRQSLYRLMERSEDFGNTINQALELSEQWFISVALKKWEKDAAKGLNTTFMKYYLQNVYRNSGWVDQTDITTDGKPIVNNSIQIEIIKPDAQDTDNGDISEDRGE